jgi:hypothetical protein
LFLCVITFLESTANWSEKRGSLRFDKVYRNSHSTGDAILIEGGITQHDEGNPVMRTLIGFGAGSSHFDAKVNFLDNRTKTVLGDIAVDQMSWALGGMMAGTQDVKSHMELSASKIAEELKKAKVQIK